MNRIFEPFLLSLIAGSATGVGGIIVLMLGKVSDRVVSFSMGFASGVMLLVSFHDLFLEAVKLLSHFDLMVMFSLGALVMIALDLTIPHIELAMKRGGVAGSKMFRTGLLIAIGIALHNFPEGLVVSTGYTYLPRLGYIIAIAIMLHNIPEGLATAVPLRVAGVRKLRVAMLTFLSGMAEPVGALVGSTVLSFVTGHQVIGSSLAFAAG